MITNVLWIVALFVWVFMLIRMRMNKDNKHAQLVQTIIEKNPEAGNVEDVMKKIAPRQKLLKEKLLAKLLWGSLALLLSIGFLGFAAWLGYAGHCSPKDININAFIGMILLAIGVAFLLNYFISKKMLAKEIEAEEKKLTAEANL